MPVLHVADGIWDPASLAGLEPGTLGLLIVRGLLARRVAFEGRGRTELLGSGDVIRPWDEDAAHSSLPTTATWTALTSVAVATLTPRFAAVMGRWPALADELMGRALRRSRSQTLLAGDQRLRSRRPSPAGRPVAPRRPVGSCRL